jgi:hypothetical protein
MHKTEQSFLVLANPVQSGNLLVFPIEQACNETDSVFVFTRTHQGKSCPILAGPDGHTLKYYKLTLVFARSSARRITSARGEP